MQKNYTDLVSIYMLTYNRKKYLKEAIAAVLKQTYKNFKLIILDNGSTDGTKEMVQSINDLRVEYRYSKSEGYHTNTQKAFDECTTEFLIVLHDDDIVDATYLEEILFIIYSSDYVAVSVAARFINENGDLLSGGIFSDTNHVYEKEQYFKQFYSKKAISMVYPSVIYRHSFYKDHKIFIDNFNCRDQYLWFQTERYGGKFFFYNKQLISYRLHVAQESNLNRGFMDMQLLDFIMHDMYYYKLLKKFSHGVRYRVWHIYLVIVNKYYHGLIETEKFNSFIEYDYIKELKKTIPGKILYAKILFFIKFKTLSRIIVKLHDILCD